MKYKDKNDILEEVLTTSLKELSRLYSKETGSPYIFEFWHNARAKDKDKNQCFSAVIDVRRFDENGKVNSFKRVYDRMVIQRPNIAKNQDGTTNIEKPSYGKQVNYEETRNAILREILSKAIGGFALGMAVRSKEEIEQFNEVVEQPLTEDESFDLGYKHSFIIPEKFKNPDGTYSVPDDKQIPQEFWGKVVTSREIVWN